MTSLITLNVTLRRAHNLAERIAERMAQLREELPRLARETTVHGFHGETQVAQLQASAEATVRVLAEHERLAALQADIRSRVAVANVSAGVSALLARIEAKRKQLALLKTFLECKPDADTLSVAALREWRPPEGNALRAPTVNVNALQAQDFERVASARTVLERELFALTDELAERNAHKVSLDIPADLAHALGLAGASEPVGTK